MKIFEQSCNTNRIQRLTGTFSNFHLLIPYCLAFAAWYSLHIVLLYGLQIHISYKYSVPYFCNMEYEQ